MNISTQLLLTWRFLSSPILEICIFFLPILCCGFGISARSNFEGGLPASFKLTFSDRSVKRDRSIKWTYWNNKVSSLNHKQVPATSLAVASRGTAMLSTTSSQDFNSYNSSFRSDGGDRNVSPRQNLTSRRPKGKDHFSLRFRSDPSLREMMSWHLRSVTFAAVLSANDLTEEAFLTNI